MLGGEINGSHRGGGIVHRDVPNRELLVADPDTEFLESICKISVGNLNVGNKSVYSAVEDEVAHYTSRSVLHEDTSMVIPRSRRHCDYHVYQRGRLGDLPVKPGGIAGGANSSEIDVEVTNCTEEIVLTTISDRK
jgi:hypothetical protein